MSTNTIKKELAHLAKTEAQSHFNQSLGKLWACDKDIIASWNVEIEGNWHGVGLHEPPKDNLFFEFYASAFSNSLLHLWTHFIETTDPLLFVQTHYGDSYTDSPVKGFFDSQGIVLSYASEESKQKVEDAVSELWVDALSRL